MDGRRIDIEEVDKTNTYRSKKERRKLMGLKLKKKRWKRQLNNLKKNLPN